MEALLHGLDQAAQASLAAPVWVLLAGHSLTAVDALHGLSPFWLVSWLLGFTAAYGGGTLSALLLQNPGAASVALFSKNEVGLVYTLVWWAHSYLPRGLPRRAYGASPVLRCAAQLCRAVLRATTIVQRVNAAARLHPGVVAAPVILGTLAGAGGKLLTDAFLHCAGYQKGPNELSHPGYVLRSAAVGACLQYVSVHVLGVLSPQQGLGLVITLYVAHSLATDITGQPCDYTAPLGTLFHKEDGNGDDLAAAAAALVHAAVQRTSRQRGAAGSGVQLE
ncbi:hypothetical protein ABPG77_000194 [Micractinium sp. CCAP 211/92]